MTKDYGTANYHMQALNECLARTSLAGKRVLEFGGSNLPRELVVGALGVAEWVCVDLVDSDHYGFLLQAGHYAAEAIHPAADIHERLGSDRYLIFSGSIETATGLPDGYFDLAFSVAAMEHILPMAAALANVRRALKPGGALFSYHGPIWSSRQGHHLWVDPELNFNVPGAVPDHAHLLLRPPAMYAALAARFGPARAEAAVEQIYHSPRINRLFYEDYQAYLGQAGFTDLRFDPYGVEEVPPEILTRLHLLYPRHQMFAAYGMIAFCSRPTEVS